MGDGKSMPQPYFVFDQDSYYIVSFGFESL